MQKFRKVSLEASRTNLPGSTQVTVWYTTC